MAISALLLGLWPASPVYHAVGGVLVNASDGAPAPTRLVVDARTVTAPATNARIAGAVRGERSVFVVVSARARTGHGAKVLLATGNDAVIAIVRAADVNGPRARAAVTAAGSLVSSQRRRVAAADDALSAFRQQMRTADVTSELAQVDEQLAAAIARRSPRRVVADLQARRLELSSVQPRNAQLVAEQDAARRGLAAATVALRQTQRAAADPPPPATAVAPSGTFVSGTERPPLRLGEAAILGILAIILFDVMFVTRTRWLSWVPERRLFRRASRA